MKSNKKLDLGDFDVKGLFTLQQNISKQISFLKSKKANRPPVVWAYLRVSTLE